MRAKTNNVQPGEISRGGYTIDQFLGMLDGVSRSGKGWIARCPAHDDGRPSLRVSEGDRGIMVNCWAGCTFHEITGAMGINPSMMFYDALDEQQLRERRAAGLRRHIQHLETRIYFGQQALDAGTISDPDRELLKTCICDLIETKRELSETEKM